MAASQDLKLYSFDISNAYLQTELKKEGESLPINYLLGILIQQNIEHGTVTLTQKLWQP